MRGCPRAYIHMVKIVLKPCGTLRIVTYHHALQQMFTATHYINTNLMVALSLLQFHSSINIQ
jgi:hypothetical protein